MTLNELLFKTDNRVQNSLCLPYREFLVFLLQFVGTSCNFGAL